MAQAEKGIVSAALKNIEDPLEVGTWSGCRTNAAMPYNRSTDGMAGVCYQILTFAHAETNQPGASTAVICTIANSSSGAELRAANV